MEAPVVESSAPTSTPGRHGRTAGRVRGLAAVLALIALSFAIGATLHTGAEIVGLNEPVIIGATVVEGICALAFAAATAALATGARRRGRTVRIAHLIGIVGVLLGILTLDLNLGPRTLSNDLYHLAVLATMLLTLRYYEHRIEPRRGSGTRPESDHPFSGKQ